LLAGEGHRGGVEGWRRIKARAAASAPSKLGMRWCTGRGGLATSRSSSASHTRFRIAHFHAPPLSPPFPAASPAVAAAAGELSAMAASSTSDRALIASRAAASSASRRSSDSAAAADSSGATRRSPDAISAAETSSPPGCSDAIESSPNSALDALCAACAAENPGKAALRFRACAERQGSSTRNGLGSFGGAGWRKQ
ncbi:hypothetical protein CLOM_g8189, partial [Closterium sp. NIES-68]